METQNGRAGNRVPWNKGLSLNALGELCEGGGATADDRHALTAFVDGLPEAIGTAPFTSALAALART